MPTILPISDLRNYTVVLDQVDANKPVYLMRNGRGTYVISKIDDRDAIYVMRVLYARSDFVRILQG